MCSLIHLVNKSSCFLPLHQCIHVSSLKIFPAKTTKLRLIAIRLRETNHLIHLFSSVANYRLRCYVWSGNEGGARERRNSGSRLHSFPGKSGEVSTSIGVSRFLWRPRSNHSKPPFTRETEEGEGGCGARVGGGLCTTRRTGDEMEWWRVTDPLSSTHTYRQPRHPW